MRGRQLTHIQRIEEFATEFGRAMVCSSGVCCLKLGRVVGPTSFLLARCCGSNLQPQTLVVGVAGALAVSWRPEEVPAGRMPHIKFHLTQFSWDTTLSVKGRDAQYQAQPRARITKRCVFIARTLLAIRQHIAISQLLRLGI